MAARIAAGVLLVALWFAFAASGSLGDILSAIAVAAAAAAAHVAVRRASGASAGGTRLRWIWTALRDWPRGIVRDTVTVLRVIPHARRQFGRLRRVPLDPSGPAELAWTIVGTSIAPNAYVVGWDPRERVLLVHTLDTRERDVVWRPQ